MPQRKVTPAAEAAQLLAIEALAFLAAEPERLGRFLALSGLGPSDVRAAAKDPAFLVGVLEHVVADEPLLIAFAESAKAAPRTVTQALTVLSGQAWERDIP